MRGEYFRHCKGMEEAQGYLSQLIGSAQVGKVSRYLAICSHLRSIYHLICHLNNKLGNLANGPGRLSMQ